MLVNKDMLLSMEKEKLENQNYNMSALAVANMLGYVNKVDNYRVFSKNKFIERLKTKLKLSKYKCNVILDTFQELGCIEINGDECHLLPVVNNCFLKIDFRTAQYCLDAMSPLTFKIYCYLLNKYNINKAYDCLENYFFSKAELMRMAGYQINKPNRKVITNCLSLLQELKLIDYNHTSEYRKGHRGRYYELYSVKLHTPAMASADEEDHREEQEEKKKLGMKDDIKSLEANENMCILLDKDKKEFYLSCNDIIERLQLPKYMHAYKGMVEMIDWAKDQKKNQSFFDLHEDELYRYMG